jgi:SAM-dependent methyltransferase
MFREHDRRKCEQLCQKYYAGRKFIRAVYRETVHANVSPGERLLDAGCGRYLEFSQDLSSTVQVVGLDIETIDVRNHQFPYAVQGHLEHMPFPSNYFDVIISKSVIEHLADPPAVFREFHRVLKPGGRVILSTPNKYDYVSFIAMITPYRWHRRLVNRIVGVPEDDVFPTLYRANTPARLTKELTAAGFVERDLQIINHYPVYLMFSPLLFRLGVLYERLTSLDCFRLLRGTLLAVFQKAGPETRSPDVHDCIAAAVPAVDT